MKERRNDTALGSLSPAKKMRDLEGSVSELKQNLKEANEDRRNLMSQLNKERGKAKESTDAAEKMQKELIFIRQESLISASQSRQHHAVAEHSAELHETLLALSQEKQRLAELKDGPTGSPVRRKSVELQDTLSELVVRPKSRIRSSTVSTLQPIPICCTLGLCLVCIFYAHYHNLPLQVEHRKLANMRNGSGSPGPTKVHGSPNQAMPPKSAAEHRAAVMAEALHDLKLEHSMALKELEGYRKPWGTENNLPLKVAELERVNKEKEWHVERLQVEVDCLRSQLEKNRDREKKYQKVKDSRVELVRSTFVRLDVDNSGKLDRFELAQEMYRARMRLLPPVARNKEESAEEKVQKLEQADKLLAQYDQDGRGALDYHEFLAATCDPEWGLFLPADITGQNLMALFRSEFSEDQSVSMHEKSGRNDGTESDDTHTPKAMAVMDGDTVWEKSEGFRGLTQVAGKTKGDIPIAGLLDSRKGGGWVVPTHNLEVTSKAKSAAEEVYGCEAFIVHPTHGVTFISKEGLAGLVTNPKEKAITLKRRLGWGPKEGKKGHAKGLLKAMRGAGWAEPSSLEEVLARAGYEAENMDGCVAFGIHGTEGVEFYDEEAFDDDGELATTTDHVWQTYTPREPWEELPHTAAAPLVGIAAPLVEIGVLETFDTVGWLSPPNGEAWVDPEEVTMKAMAVAQNTQGCVGFGQHPTIGVKLYNEEALEEGDFPTVSAPGWIAQRKVGGTSGARASMKDQNLAASLKKRCDSKDTEIAALKKAAERKESEVEALLTSEVEMKHEKETALSDNTELRNEVQKLKMELRTAQSKSGGTASSQGGGSDIEVKSLKVKLAEAETKVKQLGKGNTSSGKDNEKEKKLLERMSEQDKKRIADLEKQLASSKAGTVGKAGGDLKERELRADNKQLETDLAKAKEQIQQLKSESKGNTSSGGKSDKDSNKDLANELKLAQRMSDTDQKRIANLEKELENSKLPGDVQKKGSFKVRVEKGKDLKGGSDMQVRISLLPKTKEGKGKTYAFGDDVNMTWDPRPGGERGRLVIEVMSAAKGIIGSCELDAENIILQPKVHGGRRSLSLFGNGEILGNLECDIAYKQAISRT